MHIDFDLMVVVTATLYHISCNCDLFLIASILTNKNKYWIKNARTAVDIYTVLI